METAHFLELIRLVVAEDIDGVSRRLSAVPGLATTASPVGATRQRPDEFFFTAISHHMYAGDTALHMAAATFSRPAAELLIAHGADVRARNRRGAEPLHYAADGGARRPQAQADTIACLIAKSAEPNATDKSGVSPLHRAVRSRSPAAVRALLDGGADPRKPNGSGSTPLHLAVQTTGASGSGSDQARRAQAEIIRLLLERGARPTDRDARGKTVDRAATGEWIRALLNNGRAG